MEQYWGMGTIIVAVGLGRWMGQDVVAGVGPRVSYVEPGMYDLRYQIRRRFISLGNLSYRCRDNY